VFSILTYLLIGHLLLTSSTRHCCAKPTLCKQTMVFKTDKLLMKVLWQGKGYGVHLWDLVFEKTRAPRTRTFWTTAVATCHT